jgi:hypothetical protein
MLTEFNFDLACIHGKNVFGSSFMPSVTDRGAYTQVVIVNSASKTEGTHKNFNLASGTMY